MTEHTTAELKDLTGALKTGWQRFLTVYEPLRPELYRYCRYLSRSPWDAEDLAQDTMARAFVTLGSMFEGPRHPRAWLFRVASNLWIDRQRQSREEAGAVPEGRLETEPRAAREAAGTLLAQLSPQERAAVVLKDVFGWSLEESAEAVSTTVGAVKSALHRGRDKLLDPEPAPPHAPPPEVLDAFCAAFNARDVDRLTALLLDTASIEVVGIHTEYGPEAARQGVFQGMLYGSRRMAEAETRGGIEPRWKQSVLPEPARMELRLHRGEPLLLSWYQHTDGEFVRAVTRVETLGDRVTRVQNYFFTPDFLADVCRELDVPFRTNGYRNW